MSTDNTSNNKRIAKNTLMLYMRTMLTMAITLFTSRVILQVLGVDDYGIYNVVGGFVAMFGIVSGALTSSISRFLTFELGKGDTSRLNKIFCTSLNIQICISLLIVLLGELIGLWFLNYKMNIPPERLLAANWVLHCSLIAFAINLISIPFNAAIIANERMSTFAYVSILEVSCKLLIVYMLYLSPIDKLISYAILMVCVSLVVQSVYAIYCKRYFPECTYHRYFDKSLIKQMTGFAGWTFFTNGAMLFNTQGINILINIFFGVSVNAARGIATQVEAAVMRFVNDFTTAINPQITKSYAAGDLAAMNKLTCRGSKFAAFLFLCLGLPLIFETPFILKLWLTVVPEHTVWMFRLSVVGTLMTLLGNTGYTVCMATGRIRNYVLIITSIGCLVFPLTWIVYYFGAPVEATYIIYIIVYIAVDLVRLWIMKWLTGFPPIMFIREVFGRLLLVLPFCVILPIISICVLKAGILRLIITILVTETSTLASIYFLGLDVPEKNYVNTLIKKTINKFHK